LPHTLGAHHDRRGLTAMKIIEQAGFAHRRSGHRDRIDEIHRDNGLADNGGPAAAGRAVRHVAIIDIRDFDKCHDFFGTFSPLPQA
jgi:hypothetical protein